MRATLMVLMICQLCACSAANKSLRSDVPLTPAQEQRLQESLDAFDSGEIESARGMILPLVEEAPDNAAVLYETALILNSLELYGDSQRYTALGLQIQSVTRPRLFHLSGVNHHMEGDLKGARRALRDGIKEDGTYYPLHFSLALIETDLGNYTDAANSFGHVIDLVPEHANSHLGLGQSRAQTGERLAPLLSLTYFALLELDTERLPLAREMIWNLLSGSTRQTGENEFSILLALPDDDDPVGGIETIMALGAASMVLPENADRSRVEHLVEHYELVLGLLADQGVDSSSDPLWTFYDPFFSRLHKAGHTPALVYTIFGSQEYGQARVWVEANGDQLEAFMNWLDAHRPGSGE